MRIRRLWFRSLQRLPKTFRFRLAVWNAAVVILTAAVTLLVLREGVRWAILHEMDQILLEDVAEIALAVKALQPDQFQQLQEDLQRKAVGHRRHGWFAQLWDARGRLLWASEDLPGLAPPSGRRPIRIPFTRGDFRLVYHHVPAGTHGISTIQVGASLRFLHDDMARIDRTVLLAAGLVLVLAPITGFWLASRAVRPVGAITRTAARLRPGHLDERLPVRGTGDELDQLAHTVNRLLDRIAAYLQEKRDLLANAAHELRTPLAAIRSSVEVALATDRSREEYEDLLVEIIDQGTSLETLVNQLLLISETEAERLKSEFADVPLDEVAQRAVDMFRGVAESRGVTLDLRNCPAAVVPGNRSLLRQLINNLIDNAVKYTPPGGLVTVELAVDERQDGLLLTVSDTGIGIAPTDVPRVFERFFRGDKSRSRIKDAVGTGLGLSICEAVATAHGGRITCESQPGQGTRMTVWLPLQKSSCARTA
jgi:heavy metal sensor kinase